MSNYSGDTHYPYAAIQPAQPASPSGTASPHNSEAGPVSVRRPVPRRSVTTVACNNCKARKSKCDGARPICTACRNRNGPEPCQFDIESDQRRTAALKEKLKGMKGESEHYRAIIGALNSVEGQQKYALVVDHLLQTQFRPADTARAAEIMVQGLDPIKYFEALPEEPFAMTEGDMEGIEQSSFTVHPLQRPPARSGPSGHAYDRALQSEGQGGSHEEGSGHTSEDL